jgi:hypothetical protein
VSELATIGQASVVDSSSLNVILDRLNQLADCERLTLNLVVSDSIDQVFASQNAAQLTEV